MNTVTRTHTKTDIRKVFECFQADLSMLALRTQTMLLSSVDDYAHDICIMALEDCLEQVHIQLRDSTGSLVKAHEYCVGKNVSWDSHRPGGNKWPCLPSGTLNVIVFYSHESKLDKLKQSGQLKIRWSPSCISTDYSTMKNDGERLYSSGTFGLNRSSFTI